jgi:hypothetical protein
MEPSGCPVRVISTCVEPGGVPTSIRSHPYVKTSRRGLSMMMYRPETVSPLGWVHRTTPPGVGSSVASSAVHDTNNTGSINMAKT